MYYNQQVKQYDTQLFNQMRVCSYTLTCKEFLLDFAPSNNLQTYKLYKTQKEVLSYFPLPKSTKNYLKLSIKQETYKEKTHQIQQNILVQFLGVVGVVALLSVLFSLYALHPLRKALLLTEEFIKDILHDFNTPLATIQLNTSMLIEKDSQNKKLKRIQNGIVTITRLQENLKSYLNNTPVQQEEIELLSFIQSRVALLENSYKDLHYHIDIEKKTTLRTNKLAFGRIIDNLLSNASKYNKPNGLVKVIYKDTTLSIIDTGKGIKNTNKVFKRFYKEQDRGVGIGLHIVQKLCNELHVEITIASKPNKGTEVTLNLKNLTVV